MYVKDSVELINGWILPIILVDACRGIQKLMIFVNYVKSMVHFLEMKPVTF